MKKLLISILIVLLFLLSVLTILKGFTFAGLDIPGMAQIKAKSEELDASISEATVLASSDYKNVLDNIDSDIKKLEEEKKNYDDLVKMNNGRTVQIANQYQKYEIEYLWTIVGNHATSEGVVLKMDLVAGTTENNYNLNFTVTGSYIGIIDFISSIENDSVLGFKIENFALIPGTSTDDLQATFTCRDITITDIKEGMTNTDRQNNSTNTTNPAETPSNSNTTNTSNTTNVTNTTNTTNTQNTTRTNNTTNTTNTTNN